MKQKVKPILLDEQEIIKLAKEIIKYSKEVLYNPLVDIYKDIFNQNIKLNNVDILREALKQEKIFYENGYFKGKFNSKIVKELQKIGAKFRKGQGYYIETLPLDMIDLLVEKKTKVNEAVAEMDKLLDDILNNMKESFTDKSIINFNETIDNYNKQLDNNFNKYKINIDLNEKQDDLINKKYIEESSIAIKNMTIRQIELLRKQMKEYVLKEGYSTNYIARLLQNNYSLGQDRAVLIARQESNLLMAEFSKDRYNDLGIKEFEWQTANDEKVRSSHRVLDGHIFSFDNLPIIDDKTGQRGLPGQAINCRCVMVPII